MWCTWPAVASGGSGLMVLSLLMPLTVRGRAAASVTPCAGSRVHHRAQRAWAFERHFAGARTAWGLRQPRLLAVAAPLEDDNAGVVLELVGLMSQHPTQQPADGLRSRLAIGHGGLDEVGEPVLAEELPGRGPGLHDAVGVEQQAIAGLEAGLAVGRLAVLQ